MKKLFRLALIITLLLVVLSSCYKTREKQYYLDKNNYITDTAKVKNIIHNKKDNRIYLWLTDIDERYQDSTFVIKGDSVDIVITNQIFSKIKANDSIEFISAPEYFGDGYCMPIVELSVNGEKLLEFNIGYENLNKMY